MASACAHVVENKTSINNYIFFYINKTATVTHSDVKDIPRPVGSPAHIKIEEYD